MSSNEDRSAVRDPEEKETEEVGVDGGAVEGDGNEAARSDKFVVFFSRGMYILNLRCPGVTGF